MNDDKKVCDDRMCGQMKIMGCFQRPVAVGNVVIEADAIESYSKAIHLVEKGICRCCRRHDMNYSLLGRPDQRMLCVKNPLGELCAEHHSSTKTLSQLVPPGNHPLSDHEKASVPHVVGTALLHKVRRR